MSEEKPTNKSEYIRWLYKEHGAEISERTLNYYQSVTGKIIDTFIKSSFWQILNDNLRELDGRYRLQTGYPLWVSDAPLKLESKSFNSFLLKTFRKNIIENRRWPKQPKDGWILPENWFNKINDIIRTRFVVKYLDGVEFVISNVKPMCDTCHLLQETSFEARACYEL